MYTSFGKQQVDEPREQTDMVDVSNTLKNHLKLIMYSIATDWFLSLEDLFPLMWLRC